VRKAVEIGKRNSFGRKMGIPSGDFGFCGPKRCDSPKRERLRISAQAASKRSPIFIHRRRISFAKAF